MSTVMSASRRLLIEIRAETGFESLKRADGTSVSRFEMLSDPGISEAPTQWLAAEPELPQAGIHPWDEAHKAVSNPGSVGLESAPEYVEPDLLQRFPYRGPDDVSAEGLEAATPCRFSGPDPFWPPVSPNFGWHLQDGFSGLRRARDRVGIQTADGSGSPFSTPVTTRSTLRFPCAFSRTCSAISPADP